jgi:hypothetical protein
VEEMMFWLQEREITFFSEVQEMINFLEVQATTSWRVVPVLTSLIVEMALIRYWITNLRSPMSLQVIVRLLIRN